ncbi:MAG: hypothetical protein C0602_08585 [Denitrovibrio sp.]|nr:MAG: hypothetical protein C0602_08585 [Denitrovibrio sp.]
MSRIKNDRTLLIFREWQKDFESVLKKDGTLDADNQAVLDSIIYAITHKTIKYDLIVYIAEQINLHRKDELVYMQLSNVDRAALLSLKEEFEYVLKHELQGELEEITEEGGVLVLSFKETCE